MTSTTEEPKIKTVWLPLFIGFLICILFWLIWWSLAKQENEDMKIKVEAKAEMFAGYIEADMRSRLPALMRITKRWEIRGGIPEKEFISDATSYVTDLPGFQAIEWVDRSYHVRWVVPLEGNEQEKDLDLAFEKKQLAVLEKAKNSTRPTMTKPIGIAKGGKEFLIYIPLFAKGEFDGFILSVFKINEWLEYIFNIKEKSDEKNDFKVAVLFDDEPVYTQAGWNSNTESLFTVHAQTEIIDHKIIIKCIPTEAFIRESKTFLPELTAIAGLSLSILISFVIHLFQKASFEAWRTFSAKTALENEINEREKAEKELQKTSTRLDIATKAGGIGVWSWEIETGELSWNSQMYDIYGMDPDIIPTYTIWCEAIHPDDLKKVEESITKTANGLALFKETFRIVVPGGTIKHIRAAARAERNSSSKPHRVTGVNWDITELKNAEQALIHQSKIQQILMSISTNYINIPLDQVDIGIYKTLEEMGLHVSADRAYIFDYDFEKKTTSNTYEWCRNGISSQMDRLQNLPLNGIKDWVEIHQMGLPMLIPDVFSLPEGKLRKLLEPQNVKSLVAVPMNNGKDLMGFVGFDWVKDHYTFSVDEINLLRLLCQIIVNIRLRKKYESDLMESENRIDLALKGTNAGLWDWNIKTGQTVFNERWAEIVGYSLSELQPVNRETWIDLCHPDDLTNSSRLLNEHFEGRTDFYECEARMRHKNGEWIWVLDRGKVVGWDEEGKPERMTGTHVDITDKKKSEEKIRHMANHDALTDLPSLRLARDRISMAMGLAHRKRLLAAVLFIDLDGFKKVNDTYGHEAGDIVLKEAARRLLSCVRETDTVARIGGDEFLVILTELNLMENAAKIAEKIIQVMAKPFDIQENDIKIGSSIGIAIYPKNGLNADALIRNADSAMYKIKKAQKNGFAFSDHITELNKL